MPRLMSVFQDVSVLYEYYNLLHSQMFAWGITFLDCCLHTIIVGVTVWHLDSPNYILVSSPFFHTFTRLPCLISLCFFSSLHLMFYITFCYLYLPAKYLHSILLQLPFGLVYFTAVPCFRLQLMYYSLLSYIPSLWIQLVLTLLEASSVYLHIPLF